MTATDWERHLGEVLWIPETFVVSPMAGRLRRAEVEIGAAIAQGAPLGSVVSSNGMGSMIVDSPIDGIFLGWLAWEREKVVPGTLLARIGRVPASANGSAPGNGHAPSGNGHAPGERE